MGQSDLCVLRQTFKKLIKIAPKVFILFLFERYLNAVIGNIAINKKLIKTHEKSSFCKVLSKQKSLMEKKKSFQKIRNVENGGSFVLIPPDEIIMNTRRHFNSKTNVFSTATPKERNQ